MPSRSPGRTNPASSDRDDPLCELVEQWVASLEADRAPTMDAGPSLLPLEWDGRRLVHRGRIVPRPTSAADLQIYIEAAGSEHSARALAYVAANHGRAFDSVNAHDRSDVPLTWGVWGFERPAIADTLIAWKSAAPDRFEAVSAEAGIEQAGADLIAALTGDAPAQAAAESPRIVAALVHAGREPTVQKLQLEFITRTTLSKLPVERLSTADLAAFILLDLRVGPGTARELIAQTESSGGTVDRRKPWPAIVARQLEAAGHPLDRRELVRVLSSRELAI